jgi:hypothetical protein
MRQRKIIPMLLAAWLAACAPATPLPTSTPLPTFTPLDTPTITNTPRPTASPTIVRIPTQDFSQPTYTPFVLLLDGMTLTPLPGMGTPGIPGPGFLSVEHSPIKIYWGGCEPNSVLVRTEVADPEEVFSVLIFVRVSDFVEVGDITPWSGGGVMVNRGQGEFTYRLVGSKITGHDHYLRSWVHFQLVATNIEGEVVGRTRIYQNAFDMYPCPCLTPLTGCPPTPTPKP